MSARGDFWGTFQVLNDCLTRQDLIDNAPSDVAHNQRAAMLRQGLAVLTFSSVETFVRERTGELLAALDSTKLTFADLSVKLQHAVTVGAMEGVRFRLKLQEKSDRVAWLIPNLEPIAKVSSTIQHLSDYSFGYAASNLVEDDVKDILSAFGVASPWSEMTKLTRRAGSGLLDCSSEFKTIKTRRHAAAHALTSAVLHNDLLNSVRSSHAICLAFDLLLSHSVALHNTNNVPGMHGAPEVIQDHIHLVFVEPHTSPSKFAVRREQLPPPNPQIKRPTARVFADENTAFNFGVQYVSTRKSHVVLRDATSRPKKWGSW